MPLIWAAISGHGFGHAAQVVPVLNALGRLVPNLQVLLRTTVPATFFTGRLTIPWEISRVQQDIGCIQNGPLAIDVQATWHEHQQFHRSWDDRLKTEVEAMQAAKPEVILANTSYLSLAAGNAAGIPTVALVSFTWDLILSEYLDQAPSSIDSRAILQSIRQAYRQADLVLHITPAPKIAGFSRLIPIGPIAEPATSVREELTRLLKLSAEERTVLVGFGGIPLPAVPFEQAGLLSGYRFLFDGLVPPHSKRWVSTKNLPFSFKALTASVDVIVTKPGYGTLVETVASHTPMVYVRRYNFGDEQSLVDYLHRYGRGIELSMRDFKEGRWGMALRNVGRIPAPETTPPPLTGAADAAALLAPYFTEKRK